MDLDSNQSHFSHFEIQHLGFAKLKTQDVVFDPLNSDVFCTVAMHILTSRPNPFLGQASGASGNPLRFRTHSPAAYILFLFAIHENTPSRGSQWFFQTQAWNDLPHAETEAVCLY